MIKKFNENWDTFEDYLNKNEPSKQEEFNTLDFQVIGLPSGQIIYMTPKMLNYFKSREYVRFIKIWKKPTTMGIMPIKIEKYCFEDTDYNVIMELKNNITW